MQMVVILAITTQHVKIYLVGIDTTRIGTSHSTAATDATDLKGVVQTNDPGIV